MDTTGSAADTQIDRDLSGRQLGDYRLLRRLGRGAMAEVYLAEQGSLRRNVAVKVLHSNLATDESYVQRFHLEARAAASLTQANIVQIYEVGCIDRLHFIAQEYVQGWNLNELLVRRGPPEVKTALRIMRQVAAALCKAADRGIVHRDIKPENIMLSAAGEVKVADFGLARQMGDDAAPNLTKVGLTMGTPLYMSPEQVEGKSLDSRSDIYSFGITCYQMFAGEPPFRGDTALSVAVQHLSAPPPRLEDCRADLPPAVYRIVYKMMAKNPSDRYAHPRDLLRDLRTVVVDDFDEQDEDEFRALAEEGLVPRVQPRHHAVQELVRAMHTMALVSQRRRKVRYFVATTLLMAFLAGAGLSWMRRDRPLLSPATGAEVIERKQSAEEQFLHALVAGRDSEAAWKAVPLYFPNSSYYVRRAEQKLARLYLAGEENAKALELFDKFADSKDSELEYRAFGLAGQAIVLNRQGKYEASTEHLVKLLSDPELRRFINRDSELLALVWQAARDDYEKLHDRPARELEQLLQSEFPQLPPRPGAGPPRSAPDRAPPRPSS